MNELSGAERFKKCLNCGSEEHRAKDCKAGKAEPKVPDDKPSVQAASTSSSQPVVQATPVLNMETFMQQAVQALRQLEAHPPRSDAAPHAQPPQPQPEGLSTASQQPPVPPASSAPNPSVKRLVIRSVVPASCCPVSGPPNSNSQPPHLEAPTQGLEMPKIRVWQTSRMRGCLRPPIPLRTRFWTLGPPMP